MNILVFTASNSAYNNLRPEHEIYLGLASRGHDLTVITHGNSAYADKFRAAGIDVIDAYTEKKISFKAIRMIRKILQGKSFDIFYATDSKTISNAAFAAIGFSVKFIVYRGTVSGLYRHDFSSYLNVLHPRIDGVICVSESVRQYVRKKLWVNKSKAVTIYKGHDLSWYQKDPADLSEFGINTNAFTIICAVNARPSKGLAFMLKATSYLSDIEDMHLLLVGKNIDVEPYTSLINNSPMKQRIHLAGYRQDAPELIAASKVLVQPSISGEGLPRAVMEALGYGVPSVVTTTGGGKEVIVEGINGFIVPVKDAQALANRVRQLYANPERYTSMSQACKETLSTTFSSKTAIENFEQYLESLLSA